MKTLFTLTVISCSLSFTAYTQNLQSMWTLKDGKKIKVFEISDAGMERSTTDISNNFSSVKNQLTVVKGKPATGQKSGRMITSYKLDSAIVYCAIDYQVHNDDSVTFAEIEPFTSLSEAEAASKSKGRTFYSNEYLYRATLLSKIPPLTKEQYLTFLKEVNKELLKPEVKKKNTPDPSKKPDEQMNQFMLTMLNKKDYQGKIIPERLNEAKEKYKGDEAVKKNLMAIKMNFIPKPQPAKAN